MTALHDLPLVYVAGPYSTGDPVENTRRAIRFADYLLDAGRCAPVVPHLTMFWHLVTPRPVDAWYAYDLAVLARCDALYRLAGQSTGADLEVEFARANGIPVFAEITELERWLR